MAVPTTLFIMMFILLCGSESYGNRRTKDGQNEEKTYGQFKVINSGKPNTLFKTIEKRGAASFAEDAEAKADENPVTGTEVTETEKDALTGQGGNVTEGTMETVKQTTGQKTEGQAVADTGTVVSTIAIAKETVAEAGVVATEVGVEADIATTKESDGAQSIGGYMIHLAIQFLATYFTFGL
ncbi:hypothetical protein QQG55_23000 [Brugia pahangi]|uniref:Uncharacterized protein n=1 Tax=Brugia pahangi TaxID=6280 RepID=A0A0N4TTC2_BRUPA|nr:unnamed protein product [Brugia pahangi]